MGPTSRSSGEMSILMQVEWISGGEGFQKVLCDGRGEWDHFEYSADCNDHGHLCAMRSS